VKGKKFRKKERERQSFRVTNKDAGKKGETIQREEKKERDRKT
jgi:hypothetical protein